MQPSVIEIQLQRDDGSWVTIWTDPNGKALNITPNAPAQLFAEVEVPVGTYVASRLAYNSFIRAIDDTGDGDADDEWFYAPGNEWIPETLEMLSKINYTYCAEILQGFYSKEFLDDLSQGYFRAEWPGPWSYNGTGGSITYDFTIPPGAPEHPNLPPRKPWNIIITAILAS
jgi:hypothetical protein